LLLLWSVVSFTGASPTWFDFHGPLPDAAKEMLLAKRSSSSRTMTTSWGDILFIMVFSQCINECKT
jgi:hypothetical protein